jgi:hypothetical protein
VFEPKCHHKCEQELRWEPGKSAVGLGSAVSAVLPIYRPPLGNESRGLERRTRKGGEHLSELLYTYSQPSIP